MSVIALLDPSLPVAGDAAPDNVGDCVIIDAVDGILQNIFPGQDIVRLPTKRRLSRTEFRAAEEAEFVFLGGTNIFCGDVARYNQWKLSASALSLLFPKLQRVISLGVGWWQYQPRVTLRSRLFLRRALHREAIHSVRDGYTQEKLLRIGVTNVENTACPTMWGLDGCSTGRANGGPIVFMLTDYNRDIDADNALILSLLSHTDDQLFYFPQGQDDIQYLHSLESYQRNASKISIPGRTLSDLDQLISIDDVSYVGTRLHGGVRFLQKRRPALILGIDNRAWEIRRSTNLPVVQRADSDSITAWLNGDLDLGSIRVASAPIRAWSDQFR